MNLNTFSFLFVVGTINIIRYNLDSGNREEMLDDAQQYSPLVVSADGGARVFYWVNFASSRYEIMRTTYNKETSSLNINYTQPVAIAQDILHLYVLARSRNTVDKYKEKTFEKVPAIAETERKEEIIILYGKKLLLAYSKIDEDIHVTGSVN